MRILIYTPETEVGEWAKEFVYINDRWHLLSDHLSFGAVNGTRNRQSRFRNEVEKEPAPQTRLDLFEKVAEFVYNKR